MLLCTLSCGHALRNGHRMSSSTTPQAFVLSRETAPAYWSQGILWIMLATHEDTGGNYSLIEELIPQGPAAPPHIHENADEMFYLLDGEATFFTGEENAPIKAGVGSMVYIPRGTRHSFQIDTPTSRLLNSYTPAGFEHQIIALALPATERVLPPAAPPFDPAEAARFAQVIAEVVAKYPSAKTTNLF